ncbi:MAG: SCP2 sterol-binding domain-containing protein [Rhodospirillaceae bacterium]|nr:SCP2 sterol-binding domain-containing protein [Rhodospirillaceae bacterium]
MSLADVTPKLQERVNQASGLDATVKFDFGDDGVIHIDGTSQPYQVSNDDNDADCTITMSLDDFKELATGELEPTTAFMMGKLKVSGDISIAMKLSSVIG